MSELILPTDFLSPERTPLDALTQLRIQIVSCQPIVALLDQTPTPMIVLNGLRQLVYANPAFLHTLDTLDLIANHDPLGMRLGELWHCMQADDSPAGCGTSYACRSCHISNTLLEAMKWGEDNDWERIQRLHLGSFEVEMRVKSMYLLGEMVLLCRFGYEPYRSPAPPEPSGVSTDGSDVEGVSGQVVDEPAVTMPEAAAAEAATTELTTIDSATTDRAATDRATTDRAATEPTTAEPARAELATPELTTTPPAIDSTSASTLALATLLTAASDPASHSSEASSVASELRPEDLTALLGIPPTVPDGMVELYSFLAACGEF